MTRSSLTLAYHVRDASGYDYYHPDREKAYLDARGRSRMSTDVQMVYKVMIEHYKDAILALCNGGRPRIASSHHEATFVAGKQTFDGRVSPRYRPTD